MTSRQDQKTSSNGKLFLPDASTGPDDTATSQQLEPSDVHEIINFLSPSPKKLSLLRRNTAGATSPQPSPTRSPPRVRNALSNLVASLTSVGSWGSKKSVHSHEGDDQDAMEDESATQPVQPPGLPDLIRALSMEAMPEEKEAEIKSQRASHLEQGGSPVSMALLDQASPSSTTRTVQNADPNRNNVTKRPDIVGSLFPPDVGLPSPDVFDMHRSLRASVDVASTPNVSIAVNDDTPIIKNGRLMVQECDDPGLELNHNYEDSLNGSPLRQALALLEDSDDLIISPTIINNTLVHTSAEQDDSASRRDDTSFSYAYEEALSLLADEGSSELRALGIAADSGREISGMEPTLLQTPEASFEFTGSVSVDRHSPELTSNDNTATAAPGRPLEAYGLVVEALHGRGDEELGIRRISDEIHAQTETSMHLLFKDEPLDFRIPAACGFHLGSDNAEQGIVAAVRAQTVNSLAGGTEQDVAPTRSDVSSRQSVGGWASSLLRFRAAAASAANSVAHATAPILVEAGVVATGVISSFEVEGKRQQPSIDETSLILQKSEQHAGTDVENLEFAAYSSAEDDVLSGKVNGLDDPFDGGKSVASSWSRLATAAASTARLATKVAAPVMTETGILAADLAEEYCKSYVAVARPSSCAAAGLSSDGKPVVGDPLAQVENNRVSSTVHKMEPGNVRDVFRQRTVVKQTTPSPGKFSDGSSATPVSSVSSTVTPMCAARGMFSARMLSPSLTEETSSMHRSSGLPRGPKATRHPNPPKGSKDVERHAKRFVDFLSKKLSVYEQMDKGGIDQSQETRWMKDQGQVSFDFDKSVFANSGDTSSESSPGSPPVPDVLSLLGSTASNSVGASDGMNAIEARHEGTISLWDMIESETKRGRVPRHCLGGSVKPEYVVLPGAEASVRSIHEGSITDWGMSSFATFSSEMGASGSLVARNNRAGDVSVSSLKRKRMSGRGLSLSGRNSALSRPSRRFHKPLSSLLKNRPGDFATMTEITEPLVFSETNSLSGQGLSPQIPSSFTNSMLCRKSMSSPDLRSLLGESLPTSHLAEKLCAISPVRNQRPGVGSAFASPAAPIIRSHSDGGDMLLYGRGAILTDAMPFREEPIFEYGILPFREEVMLDEALLQFSTLLPVNFPFTLLGSQEGSMDPVSLAMWKQLLCHWRHGEVSNTSYLLQSSKHFGITPSQSVQFVTSLDESLLEVFRERGELRFRGVGLEGSSPNKVMENLDGLRPLLADNMSISLSSFLGRFACDAADEVGVKQSGADASLLCRLAMQHLQQFSTFVEDIASFGSLSEPYQCSPSTWFSVNIKDCESVERKARRKYGGRCERVKDVLRASIVFADECSLVAGLVRLFNVSRGSEGLKISVVRVKNLFAREETSGRLVASKLPTGYRHLLFTLSLNGGFFAELQLNLAALYNVLGIDGYRIHRELSDRLEDVTAVDLVLDVLASPDRVVLKDSAAVPQRVSAGGDLGPDQCPSTPIHSNLIPSNGESPAEAGAQSRLQLPDLSKFHPSNTRSGVWTDKRGGGSPLDTVDEVAAVASYNTKLEQIESAEERTGRSKGPRSEVDLVSRMLRCGLLEAERDPRNIAVFDCLYSTFMWFLREERYSRLAATEFNTLVSETVVITSCLKCLSRCLTLSWQAACTGMIGWLDYGSSSQIERLAGCLYPTLRDLALMSSFRNDWEEAASVLGNAVLRCEQQLPLYHPFTLSLQLDFARAAFANTGEREFSRGLLELVRKKLLLYFGEVENAVFDRLRQAFDPHETFYFDIGQDPLPMLLTFSTHLEILQQKRFVSAGLNAFDIYVDCLLADTSSMIANCMTASETRMSQGARESDVGSRQYWTRTLYHFRMAFVRSLAWKGANDPNTLNLACGIARCLQELGHSEAGIRLLSTMTGNKGEEKLVQRVEEASDASECVRSMCFLPQRGSDGGNTSSLFECSRGLCFWTMAMLSVGTGMESLPQSLRFLRSANKCFARALSRVPKSNSKQQMYCVDCLRSIEAEARALIEIQQNDNS